MRGFLFRDWVTCGLLAGGIVLGAVAFSQPAYPEESNRSGKSDKAAPAMFCAPVDALRAQLEKRYGETLMAVGILNSETAINVYASDKGTFTVALVSAGGVACVQNVGKHFSLRSKPIAGSDA